MKVLAILALAILTGCLATDSDHGDKAPLYTKDNFNDKISERPHFVMFFAPWCGHCKRLAPTWDKLAEKLNTGDDVTMARVDCTEQTALCSDHGVTGYPTLKFFTKDNKEGDRYRGGRDEDALQKYINEQLHGPAEKKVEEKKDEKKEAAAAPEGEEGLTELTSDSFSKHIETGHHFIKFYAPWCGHCKRLAPTWADLARHYKDQKDVSIAKVDCTVHRDICSAQEVRGYPTLGFFSDGQKVETYSGARDFDTLKRFVEKKTGAADDKKTETHEKIPDPVPEKKSPVTQLTEATFKDGIAKGTTFVKFYAPWCGHCKRLAPTWEDLGAKYAESENINIAKVDCTVDRPVCSEHGVRGFPTLILFRNGEKSADYSGARDLDALVKFVTDKVPHDEL